jgi:hypothetical protein
MKFSTISTAFVGYVLLITTLASPLSNSDDKFLSARDVSVDITTNCQDIVYGATSVASGKTCAGVKGGILTVTADVAEGWTLTMFM